MSWAEMQKTGYATIYVDTSAMSVGDKVRVKSVYNPTHLVDKQVATVGTPLVFDLGFIKDYVKICIVQDIGGVETEVGGVYKEVGFGTSLNINVLDKTSLGGVQGILNAHQTDLLAIGDESKVTINGVEETVILVDKNRYAPYEAIFGFKYLSDTTFPSNANYISRTDVQNYLSSIYTNMAERDRQYIKDKTVNYRVNTTMGQTDQKIWLPSSKETSAHSYTTTDVHFSYYSTTAQRIKSPKGGTGGTWQTCNYGVQVANNCDYVGANGVLSYGTGSYYVCPHFHLVADS